MKSHESDLLGLATCIYYDAVAKCSAIPDERDLETMRSRHRYEGDAFFCITLPAFGKDFDLCLDQGRVVPTAFRQFRKAGAIPSFLKGMLGLVFNLTTGDLHERPDIGSIEGVRQIAYTFKKLDRPYSPQKAASAIRVFIEDEHGFCESEMDPGDFAEFSEVSRVMWRNSLGDILPFSLLPKHGPGATADKLSGNRKYALKRWHQRLEGYFPLLHNVFPNENAYESSEYDDIVDVPFDEEQPVKVTLVPKDSKGPRIIAVEPTCMQYAQQAIARALVQRLETLKLTKGHINFTDQTVNQRLAIKSSIDGSSATLDLSSASDRVPRDLALSMFDSNPDLKGAIEACRSTRAELPDKTILSLKKFASMGSALCFPVESMYFYTLCVLGLLKSRKLLVTDNNVFRVSRLVYVYGDDIIIPVSDADIVRATLQKYYCKVNATKSFWTGRFRESCGVDAYSGYVVTPTYVRCDRPMNKQSASALISWVQTSNLLWKKGYWRASSHMMEKCESILGPLPFVADTCAGLCKQTFQGWETVGIRDPDPEKRYHASFVKMWIPTPVYRTDILDGFAALTKCLLKLESSLPNDDEMFGSERHLRITARHGFVTLKRRWSLPY